MLLCHYRFQNQILFLKKLLVLLGQSIPKERCTCKSETNWGSSIRTNPLPACFPHMDNRLKRLGAWLWFASSSSSKDSQIDKLLKPFSSVSIGSMLLLSN